MAELIVRASSADRALMARVLVGEPRHRPHRLVVDAACGTTATRSMSAAARRAGTPFLLDPQTYYLQGEQHDADPWSLLPFATSRAQGIAELSQPAVQDALVAGVIDFQIQAGATAVIAPYVHLENADTGWLPVQVGLWQATRRYLSTRAIRLPIVAVVALGWRELDRTRWNGLLHPLLHALHGLGPTEVALSASKVDQGQTSTHRVASYCAVLSELSASWPVLAWRQGVLGELAVAAGAVGYETGIGWWERCDLQAAAREHRLTPVPGPRQARPVYVAALGRSLPKRSVEHLLGADPRTAAAITCMEPLCCPEGRAALLTDSRAHAIAARRRDLDLLNTAASPRWRWNWLAQRASAGLAVADRINVLAARTPGITHVDTRALIAILAIADQERVATRRAA